MCLLDKLTGMDDFKCIRCNAPLTSISLENETVQACPKGHGVWLEREKLVRLVEDQSDDATPEAEQAAWSKSGDAPRAMESERYYNCPACGSTLSKENWKYGSGVVVDQCDEHGIWVDGGEIERIEAWTEAWFAHTS